MCKVEGWGSFYSKARKIDGVYRFDSYSIDEQYVYVIQQYKSYVDYIFQKLPIITSFLFTNFCLPFVTDTITSQSFHWLKKNKPKYISFKNTVKPPYSEQQRDPPKSVH